MPKLDDIYDWVEIPGFPGYLANELGRIKGPKGKVLSPHKTKRTGYLTVSPSMGGRIRTKLVHRLVALAFLGPCPDNMEVNHKDGVRTNCRADNLEYLTHSDNKKHGYAIGISRSSKGETNGHHKLTENDVRELRRLSGRVSQRKLAKRYKVSQQVISKAILGQTWKHVI